MTHCHWKFVFWEKHCWGRFRGGRWNRSSPRAWNFPSLTWRKHHFLQNRSISNFWKAGTFPCWMINLVTSHSTGGNSATRWSASKTAFQISTARVVSLYHLDEATSFEAQLGWVLFSSEKILFWKVFWLWNVHLCLGNTRCWCCFSSTKVAIDEIGTESASRWTRRRLGGDGSVGFWGTIVVFRGAVVFHDAAEARFYWDHFDFRSILNGQSLFFNFQTRMAPKKVRKT